ncbi:MAG TPA: hypothetical protein VJU18_08950 [Vicinamibacteria bacterium]|nr:hypothetical protein [Vicinamibacteria bacterium]
MAKNLADLMIKLSRDPKLRESFKKDPDGVMDAHALTAEDKAVLRSGDPDKIRAHLGDDAPTGCCMLVFI